MKKALVPILAVIAIAAVVLCFVINGQKNDTANQLNDVKDQLTEMTSLKEAAEKTADELESKAGELESKAAELESKAAELESKTAELENKVTELEAVVADYEAQQAAAQAVPGPATVDVQLSPNKQIIAAMAGATDEGSAKMINTVCEIIENLGIRYITDGVDSEVFLSLKNEPVLSAAILKDDDGFKVLSDLIPNSILSVSAKDLGSQVSLNPETFTGLFTEPVTKAVNEITSHIGAPEAVEETIHDVVFTSKAPLNMTTRELLLTVLNCAKEIASSEDFAKVQETIAQLNVNFDASSIDEAIEKITNSKDEDLPVLDAGTYTNEAGDSVTRILLKEEEKVSSIVFGTVTGITIAEADIPDSLKLRLQSDKSGTTDLSLEIAAQPGMMIGITGNITKAEAATSGNFKVTVAGMELLGLSFTKTGSGELTGSFSAEGKAEYSFEDLQDQSSEKYASFMKDVQAGAFTLLTKAVKVMPEIASLMGQTEEQPAQTEEQPAPVEEQPAPAEEQPAQAEEQPAQAEEQPATP